MSLEPLFEPRSVVVVGASNDPNKSSGVPLLYLRERFAGRLSVVHPTRSAVQGVAAVPSLDALDHTPDLAMILLPADAAVESARACARAGIRAAIVIGAGFSEVGGEGAQLEGQLQEIARESGMRLLGPNTVGLMNPQNGLFATFSIVAERAKLRSGPAAFLSASGGMATLILPPASRDGLRFRLTCHVGNEADVSYGEVLRYMVNAPDIDLILTYLEGVRDPAALELAFAEASERGTRIVALKAGTSDVGVRAVSSHTGAMAGSRDGFQALARRYGVVLVHTPDELVNVGKMLAMTSPPSGRRLAIVTASGGGGVVQADHADRLDLSLPAPSSALQARIRALIPPFGSANNPIDTTPAIFSAPDDMGDLVRLLGNSDEYDAVSLVLSGKEELAFAICDAVAAATADTTATVAVTWVGVSSDVLDASVRAGLATYRSLDEAIDAIDGALFSDAEARAHAGMSAFEQRRKTVDPQMRAPKLLRDGVDLHAWLEAQGMPLVPTYRVSNVGELDTLELGPGPWVAKIAAGGGVLHRTEHGGVRLGLATRNDVETAVADLLELSALLSDLPVVEIQRQVRGRIELVAALRRDDDYGWLLVIGIGGYLTEIVAETQTVLAPATAQVVAGAIERLFSGRLVAHARGLSAGEVHTLASHLARLSEAAALLHPNVKEIELNPVVVGEEGPFAVDWIVVSTSDQPEEG